jgi:hypothetical protein
MCELVMATNYGWAEMVLAAADLPTSQVNVDNFVRWMVAEEPAEDWWHNNDPLNANNLTEGDQESFPSLNAALLATAAVLRQSNMAGIYAVLQAQGTLEAFSAAVVASPWAASHYGGNPDHIAQIPLPPEVTAPGTSPSPAPPVPVPPPTIEEYEIMDSVVLSNGTIVSHAVGAPGTPNAGHYFEITRQAGTQGTLPTTANTEIQDMTAAFGGFPIVAP